MTLYMRASLVAFMLTLIPGVVLAQTTSAAPPAKTAAPAVFPRAISAKYVKESAGKARRDTCLDQYKSNKSANGNGGLRWIQKGGGYYSACSTKLKG
jgi:hypothetical protein